jgi:hypothetical protein
METIHQICNINIQYWKLKFRHTKVFLCNFAISGDQTEQTIRNDTPTGEEQRRAQQTKEVLERVERSGGVITRAYGGTCALGISHRAVMPSQ